MPAVRAHVLRCGTDVPDAALDRRAFVLQDVEPAQIIERLAVIEASGVRGMLVRAELDHRPTQSVAIRTTNALSAEPSSWTMIGGFQGLARRFRLMQTAVYGVLRNVSRRTFGYG